MANNTVQFRDTELKARLHKMALMASDGSAEMQNFTIGEIARECIERYLFMMQESLKEIDLTEAEASLICDALNGSTGLTEISILQQCLWANVADFAHFEDQDLKSLGLDASHRKWDCDYDALILKLRSLTTAQAFAVWDAVHRFWHNSETYHIESIHDQLIKVGLIKT